MRQRNAETLIYEGKGQIEAAIVLVIRVTVDKYFVYSAQNFVLESLSKGLDMGVIILYGSKAFREVSESVTQLGSWRL